MNKSERINQEQYEQWKQHQRGELVTIPLTPEQRKTHGWMPVPAGDKP